MIYGYIRVSSDKQTGDNQRQEILTFAAEVGLSVDRFIEEKVGGAKSLSSRKLGQLLAAMQEGDTLLVTEVSRLGRSIMEVMSILHTLMGRRAKVLTTNDRYEFGNNITSQVVAFALSLSAEMESAMISQRTREALARKKSEGKQLGRPKGSRSRETKLTGKDAIIQDYLQRHIPQTVMARLLDVNRLTLRNYIKTRNLDRTE
jgi:DNA invertase Pin-like site-specific DNA recombinase